MTTTAKTDNALEELRKRGLRKDAAAYRMVGCVEALLPYLERELPVNSVIDVGVKRLRELAEEFEAVR